ncbi:MAG: C69 family dipeptidase, partial [Thermoguttaceae bacterium]
MQPSHSSFCGIPVGKLLGALLPLFAWAAVAAISLPANACTSILVSRGASADGSVIITYSCDDAGCFSSLGITPAADHKPGEMIEISPRSPADKNPRGRIPQVPHTYKVLSGLMNEHQLAMSETTFTCRPQAVNPQGLLSYGLMMMLGMQRARTAREAIQVMTRLVEEYGYGDAGESISVADPQEVWIFEIVGSGPGGKGGVWVAARVPEGE